ncbi:Kelch-like protein 8 [Oryzias melastigma]|uniref:Kelch-like protein 8 n=1 Tax=Oryzias melastigma TaxID=30732 RepID=A0A834CQF0_ORYME|nr:Kelch-like protein 8 [Oryzias melastigma]
MAPGDVVPDHAKQLKSKDKRSGNRTFKGECEPDGSYVFEAHEAWKEFHNSLRHFYEVGELCDVTLKVGSKLIPCHKLVLACVIPYFRWELVACVSHCRAGAGVAVCSSHVSLIRDVGQGSSNVVNCM